MRPPGLWGRGDHDSRRWGICRRCLAVADLRRRQRRRCCLASHSLAQVDGWRHGVIVIEQNRLDSVIIRLRQPDRFGWPGSLTGVRSRRHRVDSAGTLLVCAAWRRTGRRPGALHLIGDPGVMWRWGFRGIDCGQKRQQDVILLAVAALRVLADGRRRQRLNWRVCGLLHRLGPVLVGLDGPGFDPPGFDRLWLAWLDHVGLLNRFGVRNAPDDLESPAADGASFDLADPVGRHLEDKPATGALCSQHHPIPHQGPGAPVDRRRGIPTDSLTNPPAQVQHRVTSCFLFASRLPR